MNQCRTQVFQMLFGSLKASSQFLPCVLQLQSLLPFQQACPAENVIEEFGLSGADLPKQLFS